MQCRRSGQRPGCVKSHRLAHSTRARLEGVACGRQAARTPPYDYLFQNSSANAAAPTMVRCMRCKRLIRRRSAPPRSESGAATDDPAREEHTAPRPSFGSGDSNHRRLDVNKLGQLVVCMANDKSYSERASHCCTATEVWKPRGDSGIRDGRLGMEGCTRVNRIHARPQIARSIRSHPLQKSRLARLRTNCLCLACLEDCMDLRIGCRRPEA